MLKEIVDIGRVSNELGSVFTFKGLPNFYVETTFEWNGEDFTLAPDSPIRHAHDVEKYLDLRVHRGKKGSTLYFFPTSFIVTKKELTSEKQKLIKKLQDGKNKILSFLGDEKHKEIKLTLGKLSDSIITNLDYILDLANDGMNRANEDNDKKDKKTESIAIVVHADNIDKDKIFDIFQSIEFQGYTGELTTGSGKKKEHIKSSCNITQEEDFLYYPSGSFYYPFSTDKINVKYNLTDDKNLFVLSKRAYIDFLTRQTFLENYNGFYFMGMRSYITATCLSDDVLREFQEYIKEAKSDIGSLLRLVEKAESSQNELLLNFYFYEIKKGAGGTKDIIEYIKDVVPPKLIKNIKLFDEELVPYFENEFNREFKGYNWQRHIHNIYFQESDRKFRTALFRKLALGEIVGIGQLLLFMNEKMQSGINKDDGKQRYYYGDVLKHFIFLNWIAKINKGETEMSEVEQQALFKGKTYTERLGYFLKNANLVKDSPSMRVGICVGLSIKILGWDITNYDKKVLAFVGKRIERNSLNSLEIFINEIFAKTKLHSYGHLHSVNINFATLDVLNISDSSFDKDRFVFGLFLGSELYGNLKSEKDPIDATAKEEAEEKLNEGEDDE
jgi:hypothetical protein